MSDPSDLVTITLPPHAAEVMYVFGFPDGVDACGDLWWRNDGGTIRLFVQCSDTFHWASADCEPIVEADVPTLRQAWADLRATDDDYADCYLAELFVSRKRCWCPMERWLESVSVSPVVADLFRACGPQQAPWIAPAPSLSGED